MIRLLLEGGRDCLESVQTSIRSGIHVIVVKVTGCLVNFAEYELAFLALKLNYTDYHVYRYVPVMNNFDF